MVMPKVKLHLLNIFQLRIKKNKLEYEGKTIKDVISKFIDEYGDKLDEELLSEDGKRIHPQMLVLVNGRDINNLKNYKTKLKEGDEIHLSFPLSGG